MRHLSIDIETFSDIDIQKAGAYRYAQSEQFRIMLFAYSFDGEEVQVVDLENGEEIPHFILTALQDKEVIKHAYNAAFEWYCLNRAGIKTPLNQWQCTMVHAMYLSLPAGLANTGEALGIPEDKKKSAVGKQLIRYFCVKPYKPDAVKWKAFKEYNRQDVVSEMEIENRLSGFPVPELEWARWRQDIAMNAYGVKVDTELVNGAIKIQEWCEEELLNEAVRLTQLENPNSPTQLLNWVNAQGYPLENTQKATIESALKEDLPLKVRRVLEIRQQLGKTSVKKYEAMTNTIGEGDRVRGISQFYGASKTGRFSGRLVQMQNLPRNYLEPLAETRECVKRQDYETLKLLFDSIPDTLSQLIRTAFIPSTGNQFVVADFSAIEARVIAWLAKETWVQEVFATHGKIYEATASQMFHVPIEKIAKGNPEYALRQKGKVATLALGYQGGTNALISMGALKMGLSEDELPEIVARWRAANQRIVALWSAVGSYALRTVRDGRARQVNDLIFRMEQDLKNGLRFLTIELPSKRKLFYCKPYIGLNQFGGESLYFYTQNQTTKKWEESSTFGGKLVENIVQGIARDCLCETLDRITSKGYRIVFHVHDEVIVDAGMDLTVDELCSIMAEPIPWAKGLILKGAGFSGQFYQKD
jgi:DNA-directed DNA polymerase|nr:MAG TPA: DNA polymerase I [Caudoviricetes sp.]